MATQNPVYLRTHTIDAYRSRTLVFALLLLVTLAVYDDAAWRPMVFFAHIGVVLLWQPIVPHRLRLTATQIATIAVVGAIVSAFLSAWVLLVWTVLLTGLTAGRITMLAPRQERVFYWCSLAFLFVILFLLLVPALLPAYLRSGLPSGLPKNWLSTALEVTLIPLAVLAWRADRVAAGRSAARDATGAAYDLVYTAWVVGLLLLVIFCGIALMALLRLSYLESMAITLISMSGVLVAFSWLSAWFEGDEKRPGGILPTLLSRYLLSFGLPYEVWLDKLTALHREQSDPASFFNDAMRALGALAIVAGAEWRGAGMSGRFGALEGGDVTTILIEEGGGDSVRQIEVLLRTREVLSPSFVWHFKLLIGLAAEFHWAKAREAALVQSNYLRAVHETGARLTHDVKNLLQSINGLIEAVNCVEGEGEVRKLIGRQLPEVAQRLALTIEKLQVPSTDSERLVKLTEWWAAVSRRHAAAGVVFAPIDVEKDVPIVESLFDSAVENLLSNALRKRSVRAGLSVRLTLVGRQTAISLVVEDDGEKMDANMVARLFQAPVPSRDGLGIGLYQLARRATELGFQLAVAENRQGCVRFVLTNQPLE